MLDSHCYTLRNIANWDDLLKEYQTLSSLQAGEGKGWIFRGEKDPSYALATSLERATTNFGYQLKEAPLLEHKILREFKRRLHHYTTDTPHKKDIVEWLALMQHYGAPSRLLDWTYSFFVAVFFAIESAEHDICIVWALKMDSFNAQEMREKDQVKTLYRNYLNDDASLKDEPWLQQSAIVDYLLQHPQLLVFSVNPFRLNERLTIQQGSFLMPGDLSKSFDENLMAHADLQSKLMRMEINSATKSRKDILINLHRMNISKASLFPGLAGFAESLKTRLAFHELLSGIDI